MQPFLRRWLYFDREGIDSLHGQCSGLRVTGQTISDSTVTSGLVSGQAGVSYPGLRAGISTSLESRNGRESSHRVEVSHERTLIEVEEYLAARDQLVHLAGARDVALVYSSGLSPFVVGILPFRWASTHSIDPVVDAHKKQMVEFVFDRDVDDNSGMLAVPLRLTGSISKCVGPKRLDDGSLSPTSHLAMFIRSLATDSVRFGFFGHLQPLPKLLLLKPYAVWFA